MSTRRKAKPQRCRVIWAVVNWATRPQNIQIQASFTKENNQKSTRKRTIQVSQNNQQSGQISSGSQQQFNRGSKVAKTKIITPKFSLPPEVLLDVLKCLDFNQLFSLRQANFYFCNLINKYEVELARMKFSRLTNIKLSSKIFQNAKYVKLESGIFGFTLNDQLKEKWQAALEKSIPLYLNHLITERPILVRIVTIEGGRYILCLPNFPEDIEDMINLRCWLERIFNCAFERSYIGYTFNPEMIDILFDDDKTIPRQFLTQ
uniref:F-box domain-containing protein n=1 Tax=Meloidogyne incognita TaxID=6306 RepID=A0A914KII1_MELIC